MKVTLKGIDKNYGTTEVIKGLDLEINSGELMAIVGPSGCGKSTTLFMLSGLEPVTNGSIYFGEDDVTTLSADKRDIGLVFQNYALYPHYTVLKNVMFPLLNKKIPKDEAKKQAMEVIEAVGLSDQINQTPGQLSGGQQQRVAIARAIVKKPKLLLLDEPLSNLDAKLKMSTILEIKKIQRKFNITTLFVTHDQQEALAISDRMIVLHDGNVQQVGKPNDLYRNPKNKFVSEFIGSPPINTFDVEIQGGNIVGMDALIEEDIKVKDGSYTIGVRPEALKISENGLEYQIKDFEILGRDILYYLEFNNCELRVLISNTADSFDENITKIKLAASTKDIHLFNNVSGEVINFER